VSENPVTCCIYFHPFGRHCVIDSFTRIEFEHRGSPHAHNLLWLADNQKEPRTVVLVESLCSMSANDVPDDAVYGAARRDVALVNRAD
jgi:hypothetical protein